MTSHRSILGRLAFATIACTLICTIVSAEMPELLTLTDNTSNDYAVRKANVLGSIRALSSAKQAGACCSISVPLHSLLESWTVAFQDASQTPSGLFILHSVLRR
jgi:hypothetical protein